IRDFHVTGVQTCALPILFLVSVRFFMASSNSAAQPAQNSKFRVLTASLVGTTIEFFDFYIYATAAVIIFPYLFFPASTDPMTARSEERRVGKECRFRGAA